MDVDTLVRFATAEDGTRVAWTERGSGPPVLMIMGLGADGAVWEPHLTHLARDFRCLVADNRGTGRSDAPEGPYSTQQMADDCAAVIDAAGEEAVAVIGISMGGAIAQQLALRHPERVTALILTASWAGSHPVSEDVLWELEEIRALGDPALLARRLHLLIWSPEAYAREVTTLHAQRAKVEGFAMGSAAFSAQCVACRSHDVRDRLGEISVPVLVTGGRVDVFTPLSASVELADGLPHATLMIFDGGHAHHWEELDRYNAACEEFLHAHA